MIPAYVIIAMGREGWYTREAVALTRALFFPPFVSQPGSRFPYRPSVTQEGRTLFDPLLQRRANLTMTPRHSATPRAVYRFKYRHRPDDNNNCVTDTRFMPVFLPITPSPPPTIHLIIGN